MDRLKNRCALLMGATSGIGQSCADMFAREGAPIVVTGLRLAHGEAVAPTIVQAGGDATFQVCDVTQPESVEDAVRYAIGRMGGLISSPNNAGRSGNADGPVISAAIDEF
jgi:NAD(P)-dependent dehydrogenase (short-subunit alcohol dehydrogenase family)